MPTELSVAQLRALYAAAVGIQNLEQTWPAKASALMLGEAGRGWRANLRKALAEVSRELAKATFTKRRK